MIDQGAALRVHFPLYCTGAAISRCVLSLGDHFRSDALDFEYWCTGVRPAERRPYHRTPLSELAAKLEFSLPGGESRLQRRLEKIYAATAAPDDIAYLWPGSSVALYRALRERGVTIVTEMVNSSASNCRRTLDDAYAKWGLRDANRLSTSFIEDEETRLALSDYVFSPSPLVTETLLAAGVPSYKILHTSFAWDPRTFSPAARRRRPSGQGPVFLSVAFGSIRKGYPELLEAWSQSGSRGTLRLVGPLDEEVRSVSAKHLARDDVEVLPYTQDLAPLYASADAFVLASHEEGSPVVAYLALAAGLPLLASPAVASGIVEDEVHGIVRATDDLEGWVEAIRRLSEEANLRRRLGARGRARAQRFTWPVVAEQRRELLETLVGGRTPERASPAEEATARTV